MIFLAWGWKNWILFILAAGVVASYFGVLAPVQDLVEQLAASGPVQRAANQPEVVERFQDKAEGRMDAYIVVFLFMFLSPLALFMAVTITIFLLSALANALAPLMGGERIAFLVLEIVGATVVYVERDVWVPHALYWLGLLARAYVVITS